MNPAELYDESITLPRAIRFPIELIPPHGFDPESPKTWPQLAGRLEYFEGRLLYMPPCGEAQQYTVTDVVITLGGWIRAHRDFLLGTNEAGMRLRDSTRAADAAIWRRVDVGQIRRGLQRVPPILAVEVAGDDENEQNLREKAAWYLGAGVRIVWIVLPEPREVVVITPDGDQRYCSGQVLAPDSALPNLTSSVDDFFVQLSSV